MRILIFAFSVCIMNHAAAMEPKFKYEEYFERGIWQNQYHNAHQEELDFIRSSNNPLTTSVAIGNCRSCFDCALEVRRQFFSSCWRGLKFWWSKKVDDDLVHAAWLIAASKDSNPMRSEQLAQLLRVPEVIHVTRAGRPILFHAVKCMNEAMVKGLLSLGADPNQESQGEIMYAGHTPLMLAVHMNSEGDLETKKLIVWDLLAHGAQINTQRAKTLDTPLLLAQEPEIVSLLVNKGACINDQDKEGKTVFDNEHFHHDGSNEAMIKIMRNGGIHRELLKRMLVKGALRPSGANGFMRLECTREIENCSYSTCRARCALIQKRIIQMLSLANIPRELQCRILREAFPFCNLLSVDVLATFGDMITPEHCALAADYVPESVFAAVAKRLPEDKKSIFIQRSSQALCNRRLSVLKKLMETKLKKSGMYIGNVIGQQIPEYRITQDQTTWPPQQLDQDIKQKYKKMFSGE